MKRRNLMQLSAAGMAMAIFMGAGPAVANAWVAFGDMNAACDRFRAGDETPMVATVNPRVGQRLYFGASQQEKLGTWREPKCRLMYPLQGAAIPCGSHRCDRDWNQRPQFVRVSRRAEKATNRAILSFNTRL